MREIRIRIISVGKMKERYYLQAQEEYIKMLGRFAQVEVVELQDEKNMENPSPAQRQMVLSKEGARIQKAMEGFGYKIVMAIEGQQPDSMAFSKKLEEITLRASSICIVIGGSFGIDEGIKKKADYLLSLSSMTFPHRLARIVLLEQLFRGFKIMNGETCLLYTSRCV